MQTIVQMYMEKRSGVLKMVRGMGPGAAIGAGVGALGGGEDNRLTGALVGGTAGAIGGRAGLQYGRKLRIKGLRSMPSRVSVQKAGRGTGLFSPATELKAQRNRLRQRPDELSLGVGGLAGAGAGLGVAVVDEAMRGGDRGPSDRQIREWSKEQ